MLNIGVFGPGCEDISLIKEYVERYRVEKETDVSVRTFGSEEEFLSDNHTYEIALLQGDVSLSETPSLALRLRQAGGEMPIIFLSDKKQFILSDAATVDALGLLTKPLTYAAFSTMIDRAQTRLVKMDIPTVAVMTQKGSRRISVDQIYYLEGGIQHVVYHMKDGDVRVKGTLGDESKKLTADRFFRLGSYLINLGHVYKVWENDVYVGNACLPLPLNKKAAFIGSLAAFMDRG